MAPKKSLNKSPKQSRIPVPRPRVIVKFKNDQCSGDDAIPYHEDFEKDPAAYLGERWNTLAQKFPGITIRRMITSLTNKQIQEVERKSSGADHTCSTLPSFMTYFAISLPATRLNERSKRTATRLLKALQSDSWKEVLDNAHFERLSKVAGVILSDNESYYPFPQRHLDPSPDNGGNPGGVDARYAWGILGGDGDGHGGDEEDLRFMDLEHGWLTTHEDLPGRIPAQPCFGFNYDLRGHGTCTLGIIAAKNDNMDSRYPENKFCVGITPNVKTIGMASPVYLDGMQTLTYSVANAIFALINPDRPYLRSGDVLLLEVQTATESPIEVQNPEFVAIKRATSLGIVVIEPTGNNGEDFDQTEPLPLRWPWPDDQGAWFSLNPNSQYFSDSGAIMVGSAVPNLSFQAAHNTGNRIDCFAWDNGVWTTGWDDHHPKANPDPRSKRYYAFSGTSSASAMIAGVALSLQGIAQANKIKGLTSAIDNRFSPTELRDIFRDASTGTLSQNSTSANPNADRIGLMPDLRKILQKLNLVPDIYIRDDVRDNGAPHLNALGGSPDIILCNARVTDPIGAYGEGSGTKDNASLGQDALFGKDNYIYVRLQNRGRTGAENVSIQLAWSRPEGLHKPALWNWITKDCLIPQLPSGNVLAVSPAIVWLAQDLPAPDQYCFIAIVGNAADPLPQPGAFIDTADFERFVRGSNNVTVLNFSVM